MRTSKTWKLLSAFAISVFLFVSGCASNGKLPEPASEQQEKPAAEPAVTPASPQEKRKGKDEDDMKRLN